MDCFLKISQLHTVSICSENVRVMKVSGVYKSYGQLVFKHFNQKWPCMVQCGSKIINFQLFKTNLSKGFAQIFKMQNLILLFTLLRPEPLICQENLITFRYMPYYVLINSIPKTNIWQIFTDVFLSKTGVFFWKSANFTQSPINLKV